MSVSETRGGEVSALNFEQLVVGQVEVITEQAQPGGGLYAIAEAKMTEVPATQLLPSEVYNVVVPPKGAGTGPPRWELVSDAGTRAKETAAEHKDSILGVARAVGMVRQGEHEDCSQIDPSQATFVVQDGANKTSIVRRHVAAQAMHQTGATGEMYQLGSPTRRIEPTRADKSPNPEHALLRDLAGEFLPKGGFTAYDANLATALRQGYQIETIVSTSPDHLPKDLSPSTKLALQPRGEFRRAIKLMHEDRGAYPDVMLVEPTNPTFEGGLDAVRALEEAQGRPMQGRQVVAATNGQYRPMAALQVQEWSKRSGLDMLPPVVVGDEPGDVVPYLGKEFTTAARNETLYANELALLGRRATAHAVAASNRHYDLPGRVIVEGADGELIQYEPDGTTWSRGSANGLQYDSPDGPGYYPA